MFLNILFILTQSMSGLTANIFISGLISILGIIILYIFAVPVIQTKLENVIEDHRNLKIQADDHTKINADLNTRIKVLEKENDNKDELINELFSELKESRKYFQESTNTIAKTLESIDNSLQNMNKFFIK